MRSMKEQPQTSYIYALDEAEPQKAVAYAALVGEWNRTAMRPTITAVKVPLSLLLRCGRDDINKIRDASGTTVIADLKLTDVEDQVVAAIRAAHDLGLDGVTVHGRMGSDLMKQCFHDPEAQLKVYVVTEMTTPYDPLSQKELDVIVDGLPAGVAGVIAPANKPDKVRMVAERLKNKRIAVVAAGIGRQGGVEADAVKEGATYIMLGGILKAQLEELTSTMAVCSIAAGVAVRRPSVFVGSSTEGLNVARAIQAGFADDEFDCTVWEQGLFRPSETAIESLEGVADDYDFAVLVLTPDDLTASRGVLKRAIRDNVLFEFGFFMGSLGRDRVFGVQPSGVKVLPSDLAGFNAVTYRADTFVRLPDSAVGVACTKIRKEIERRGTR